MGSIGKRHYRLLQEAGETVVGVDKGDTIDWDVDMVWICTPTESHYRLATEAVMNDVPRIFVEKPMVDNIHMAQDIQSNLELNPHIRIWAAQNMRFHPGAIAVKEHLAKVGKIHYTRLHFQHALANQAPNRVVKEGIVMDCIQWIDLALWLFGPTKESRQEIWDNERATIQMNHVNGIRSVVDLDFLRQDKSCGIEVIGKKGTLKWESSSKNPESFRVDWQDKISAEFLTHGNLFPDFTYKAQLDYLLKDTWQSNLDAAIASMEVALA